MSSPLFVDSSLSIKSQQECCSHSFFSQLPETTYASKSCENEVAGGCTSFPEVVKCCSCKVYAECLSVSLTLWKELGLQLSYGAPALQPAETPRATQPSCFAARDFLLDSEIRPNLKHKRTSSETRCKRVIAEIDWLWSFESCAEVHESPPHVQCKPVVPAAPSMNANLPGAIPPRLVLQTKAHYSDMCRCSCHLLSSTFILDEFLHQGFTSTVFACRRATSLSSEIVDHCYGSLLWTTSSKQRARHKTDVILPYSSVADTSAESDHLHTPKPSYDAALAIRKSLNWLLPIQAAAEIVVKLLHKNRCTAAELQRSLAETNFLTRLNHPNVAHLLASFDAEHEHWLFFERACYLDLEECLVGCNLVEAHVQPIIRQILLALEYIHSQDIIHCDVKPKNILVFERDRLNFHPPRHNRKYEGNWHNCELKLTDFGLARFSKRGSLVTFDGVRGSQGYFAPEILLRRDYGSKIDVWATGIILFNLLAGYHPFYPASACISQKCKFEARYWSSINPEAKDLCQRLLAFDPVERLSAAEALRHPWILQASQGTLLGRKLKSGSQSHSRLLDIK